MKYTIKFIGPDSFFYPSGIGAYNDMNAGPGPEGSYLVLHLSTELADAMFYDTPEKAESLLDADFYDIGFQGGYNAFESLGVIAVPKKSIFKKKLQHK